MGPVSSAPGAVSLSRALLALARGCRSGVLRVCTEHGTCRIAVVDGVLRAASALSAVDEPLGDALMRAGELDARAHADALGSLRALPAPVGRWLLDAGLVSRPALELALRRQLRDRVVRVLSCSALDYVFEPGEADVGVPWIEEPMPSADLVLCAMRAHVSQWSSEAVLSCVPRGCLRLSELGRALTESATLWPEELVARQLLGDGEGATLAAIVSATRAPSAAEVVDSAGRAARFVAGLALLSALSAEGGESRRYSLLVRKRAQMARDAGAHVLLDVEKDAPSHEARRALRRLAHSVHPDVLGPDAPEALRRASGEVLAALANAERSLR